MERQTKPVPAIRGNGIAPAKQGRRIRPKQQKVVHVADIAFYPQLVLDEVIQSVQIKVGKMLTGSTADGQSGVGWGTKQARV